MYNDVVIAIADGVIERVSAILKHATITYSLTRSSRVVFHYNGGKLSAVFVFDCHISFWDCDLNVSLIDFCGPDIIDIISNHLVGMAKVLYD